MKTPQFRDPTNTRDVILLIFRMKEEELKAIDQKIKKKDRKIAELAGSQKVMACAKVSHNFKTF